MRKTPEHLCGHHAPETRQLGLGEASMQGLWVVGVLFGLAFLMVVGLHSVLRELLMRGGDDAGEVISEPHSRSEIANPDNGA
jgi:hypothetical protein